MGKQKFLTTYLAKEYQQKNKAKLSKQNVSCGIFQDCLNDKPADYKNKNSYGETYKT